MTFLPLFNILASDVSNFDYRILFVALVVIVGLIAIFLKKKNGKVQNEAAEDTVVQTQSSAPVTESNQEAVVTEEPVKTETPLPYTPGYVTLDGVKEQDAAVIMAITSKQTGIPLERLCFKYIKRLNQEPELINIEEQDAAVIMALVAHKTGISLDNLIFNSIKLVEE